MQNRHPTNHGAQNRANDYGSAVKNSLPPNQQFVASQPYQQYSRNQGQAIYAPPGTFDSGYVYMYPPQAQMAQRSYVINGQPTGIMNLSAYPYYATQTYQTVQQQPLQPPQPQQQPQQPQQQPQQVQHLPQYQVTQHQSQPAKSTRRMIDIVNPTTGEKINLMDVASKETATQAQVPNSLGMAGGSVGISASAGNSSVGFAPQLQRGQPQLSLQQQQQSMFYHGPSNNSADHQQQQHLQQQQHALSVKEQFASKVAATLQTHHHSSDVQTSGDQESPKQAIEAPQNINQEQQHHMLHQHQVQQSITVEQTLQKNVDSSNDSGKSSKPVVVECQKETTNVNIETNSHANSMNSVEMVSSVANNGSTIISNVVEEPTQQKRTANKIVASSAQEQHQPKHQQQPPQHQQGKQHKQQQKFQQQQKSNQQQQQPHQPQHQQQQQQQQTMLKTTQITVTKPVVKETSNVEAAVEDDGGSEWIETKSKNKKKNRGGNKDLSNQDKQHHQQQQAGAHHHHHQQQQHGSHHQQQHDVATTSKPQTQPFLETTQAKTTASTVAASQPITNEQPQAQPMAPVNWSSIVSQRPPANQQQLSAKPVQPVKQATPPPPPSSSFQPVNQTQGAINKQKTQAESTSHNESNPNKGNGKQAKKEEPVAKQQERSKHNVAEQRQDKPQDYKNRQQQGSRRQNKQKQSHITNTTNASSTTTSFSSATATTSDKTKVSDDKKQNKELKKNDEEKKDKSDKVEIPADTKMISNEIVEEMAASTASVDTSKTSKVSDSKVSKSDEKISSTEIKEIPQEQGKETATVSEQQMTATVNEAQVVDEQQHKDKPIEESSSSSTSPYVRQSTPPLESTSSDDQKSATTMPADIADVIPVEPITEQPVAAEQPAISSVVHADYPPTISQPITDATTKSDKLTELENTTLTIAAATSLAKATSSENISAASTAISSATSDSTDTSTVTAPISNTDQSTTNATASGTIASTSEAEVVNRSDSENALGDGATDDNNGDDTAKKEVLPRKGSKPQLKYTYSEDQWSPLNPEGKKCYDRNFLLQVQFSEAITKPDLPPLDIVLSKPNLSRQDSFLSNASGGEQFPNDFSNYVRSSSSSMNRGYSAKKGQESNRQNQAKRQLSNDQVQRKVIEFRLQNDITLHTAENAWKPKKEASSETEVVYKKIRAILNKLTPQKFQTLIEQVRHLPINTEERLKGCINIIFEKAVSEPNFAIAYANMAKCLFGMNVPLDSKPEETVSFRKLLLTKCQIEFEKDKEEEEVIAVIQSKIDDATLSEDDKKKLIEEKNDAMWKAKKRSLGNIKFIGELFKLKMLTEKIMHECLTKLFKFTEDEDSLECLCQLMSTIGKDIDQGPSKIHMDAYFDRMKNFVNMKKSSQRIRFMMLDVIDLRKSGWVPRRENNPKTIDQIHQEAKQEEEERQQKAAMFDQAQRKKQAEHRFNQPNMMSQSSNNIKEDGWTNVSRPPKATPLDMSKIKLTRTNVDDNIQLGPGGRGGWGRGSMGGAALKAAAPPEPEKPLLNRFSLLSNSIDSTTDSSRSGASLQLPSRDSYKGRSSGPQNQSKVQTLGRSSHEKPSYQLSEERPKSPQQQTMIPFQHSHSLRPQQTITESLMMTTTPLTMTTTTKTSASVLSSEELERKAQNIIDEYLHLNDVKEALECIADLNVKENELNARRFFYKSMEYTVERSSQVRNQIGTLHRHLLKKNLVQSPLCYTAALTRLTHFALDAVIDIPQIWEYIGEIVCPLFLESHDIPLNFLVAPFARIQGEEDFEYCGADVEDNRARLMAVVVDALSKHLGHHAASDLWKKSKLKWEDLVKCTPVTEFVRKFKIEYTIESEATQGRSRRNRLVSVNENKNELIDLFANTNTTFQQIFDWIHDNMYLSEDRGNPMDLKSVSDCCSALCMSCLLKRSDSDDAYQLEEERMVKFLPVIKTLTVDRPDRQVEILFGLQDLAARLSHPPLLLYRLFELLYDAEVTIEPAFQEWRSDQLRSSQGKGVALQSVHRFFDWLAEEERDNSIANRNED